MPGEWRKVQRKGKELNTKKKPTRRQSPDVTELRAPRPTPARSCLARRAVVRPSPEGEGSRSRHRSPGPQPRRDGVEDVVGPPGSTVSRQCASSGGSSGFLCPVCGAGETSSRQGRGGFQPCSGVEMKVSLKLRDENKRKNSLTSLEPR